ncbi:MAG: methylenetetrahydrofolate reductase C-terminal domain-containing protein [Candidatus Omnitrophica bacterium]|nr:methylenetetrahydrofolate reductase C-terminal domain-containing protein [Candidatus Omnitrophota bacterium]MBU1127920.1 methylenetetrahydrofolate reductase C-terminal domain-containing protein [Candidatus Omnitrophota bacterium]MBU1656734.1 methylenetetrahydrofolate reductase C-terminal domain-containing protein [Candidatus Omnitrophota bacterium]MBU1784307.1 methylenetetrahydrofolate reductase C-terminal domain-containing protein [Candidatus Omnitrophota bacterium]MBU1851603.1 methylenetet
MIITKQKPIEEILAAIKDAGKVFLAGCSLCATTCRTGGEKELKKLEKLLKANNKEVTGSVVLDPACNMLEVKRFCRKYRAVIDESDAVLSLACGGGTQAVSEALEGVRVYPGNNTLFQGEITKLTLQGGRFEQRCSLCGDCMLGETGGICPVTCCPKALLNGPCGGAKDGKCEIDKNMNCAWLLIYKNLKERGAISNMKTIHEPKDHSVNSNPQSLDI